MRILKKYLWGLTLVLLVNSIGFAKVPAQYFPNYDIRPYLEKLKEFIIEFDAKSEIWQEQSIDFGKFYSNFLNLKKYLPQGVDNEKTYLACESLSKDLSTRFSFIQYSSFRDRCIVPLRKIMQKIDTSKTVVAKIKASPTKGNAPLTVTFDGTQSIDPSNDTIPNDNFFRYFKDINGEYVPIGRGPIVKYTFRHPGKYIVHLTVRSSNKSQWIFDWQASVTINVLPKSAKLILQAFGRVLNPDVPFKIATTEAQRGFIVDASATHPLGGREIINYHFWVEQLNPTSRTVYEKSWEWTPKIFKIKLPEKWEYRFNLEITDNTQKKEKESWPVIVEDPVALITFSPAQGNTSTLFSFDAWASYATQAKIISYKWQIKDEDGKIIHNSLQKSFQFQFPKAGVYTVLLQVKDDLGNQSVDVIHLNVASTPPVANFVVQPLKKWKYPSVFILDGTYSWDPDVVKGEDKLFYQWGFSNLQNIKILEGDLNSPSLTVAFEKKWEYVISLTVRDLQGNASTKEEKIKIQTALRPEIIPKPRVVRLGNPIIFEGRANQKVAFWQWDFGDGTVKKTERPKVSYTYSQAWAYNVTLSVNSLAWEEQNEVTEMIFVGEKDKPIPVWEIKINNRLILPKYLKCGDEFKQAYPVQRRENVTIDFSKSLNTQGISKDLEIIIKPDDSRAATTPILNHQFQELGCHKVEVFVTDKRNGAQTKTTLWFNVENAKPTLSSLIINLPQFKNTQTMYLNMGNMASTPQMLPSPLLVEVMANGLKDPDGKISYIVWYYYEDGDPNNLLAAKTTPGNISTVVFTLDSFQPGKKYVFGLKMVDNDNDSIRSEKIIGKWPVIFIPSSYTNTDIPIVSLDVTPTTAEVGEQVKFKVKSELVSGKPDFKDARVIKYDFDGDGIYDLITKKEEVTYTYSKPGTYTPKVEVDYKGNKWFDYGDKVLIRIGLKANFIYTGKDKTFIFRDVSVGDITKRQWCPAYPKCNLGALKWIEDQTYFGYTYDSYKNYKVLLKIEDKYWNKKSALKNIKAKPQKLDQLEILSIPEIKNDTIRVGINLNNAVLYHVIWQGSGDCFVDSDVSIDTNSDGDPTNDRDFDCNETVLFSYLPRGKTTYAHIYYPGGGKELKVEFLDFDINIPGDLKWAYTQLDQIILKLEKYTNPEIAYLKNLLVSIRNSLIAWVPSDADIQQALIWLQTNSDQLSSDLAQQIKQILEDLSVPAQPPTQLVGYEYYKQTIINYFPQDTQPKIRAIFEEIESNPDMSDEQKKNKLEEILKEAKKLVEEGILEEWEFFSISREICSLLDYYSISSPTCQQPTDQIVSKTTSIVGKIIRLILIIIGVLVVIFVALIILFAIKARKEEKEAEEETE